MNAKSVATVAKDLGKLIVKLILGFWSVGLATCSALWVGSLFMGPGKVENGMTWALLGVALLSFAASLWLIAIVSGVVHMPQGDKWSTLAVGSAIVLMVWLEAGVVLTLPYVFKQTAWLLEQSGVDGWRLYPTFYGVGCMVLWPMSILYLVYPWLDANVSSEGVRTDDEM